MSDNKNEEPYNGAVRGFSPFDMDDRECNNWGDYIDDERDEYDCCDDAEDYTDDDSDSEE